MFKAAFLILTISWQASAEVSLVWRNKIYSMPSPDPVYRKFSVSHLKKADFIEILSQDDGLVFGKVQKLADPYLDAVSARPKIRRPEGCEEHPMKWLKSARAIGRIQSTDTYFELPGDFPLREAPKEVLRNAILEQSTARKMGGLPSDIDRCLQTAKIFGNERHSLALVLCRNRLNPEIWMFTRKDKGGWEYRAGYGLGEKCG